MERTSHLLTPTTLKALAHPIRVRLLGALRGDGAATATSLGVQLGESSGTTSYHLRQLAAAGLVVETEGRGNGRERWWRAAQDSTRLDAGALDEESRAAAGVYLDAVADVYVARLRRWRATEASWPRAWQDSSTTSDDRLSLTPQEARRLGEQVEELVGSYRRGPREGDESVAVQWQVFPEPPTKP